jgi:hypothetical protein
MRTRSRNYLIASVLFLFAQAASIAQLPVFGDLLSKPGRLEIVRSPSAADYSRLPTRENMASLPKYDPDSGRMWQIDLRSFDLSGFDVSDRLADLMYAHFDSKTRWPVALPAGFDPASIMDRGKNPGLGLRALHAAGIDGSGVGIAIIDQALLVDHIEYRDRLRLYEEIHWSPGSDAQMHAPAVASIAVGKTVGAAPMADLYFIACWMGDYDDKLNFSYNLGYVADSIDRVVQINGALPADRKIRAISISLGLNVRMKGFFLAEKAIARAKKAGIVTFYVGSDACYGAGREPLADPDRPDSYRAGLFWRKDKKRNAEQILLPMDARCVASPTGNEDYVYYSEGGLSWVEPYLAGLYALACQRDPRIDYAAFWAALKEGSRATMEGGSAVGRLPDPAKMIEAVDREAKKRR